MTVSPELLTRIQTERWTPLPETPQQVLAAQRVEALLTEAIHLLAEALGERKNP